MADLEHLPSACVHIGVGLLKCKLSPDSTSGFHFSYISTLSYINTYIILIQKRREEQVQIGDEPGLEANAASARMRAKKGVLRERGNYAKCLTDDIDYGSTCFRLKSRDEGPAEIDSRNLRSTSAGSKRAV